MLRQTAGRFARITGVPSVPKGYRKSAGGKRSAATGKPSPITIFRPVRGGGRVGVCRGIPAPLPGRRGRTAIKPGVEPALAGDTPGNWTNQSLDPEGVAEPAAQGNPSGTSSRCWHQAHRIPRVSSRCSATPGYARRRLQRRTEPHSNVRTGTALRQTR